MEGPDAWAHAAFSVKLPGLLALAYGVPLATFFCFGAWYWLLGRYASSTVAPFSLLVPVTGLSSAWLSLGEIPTGGQASGSAMAIAGVALTIWSARRLQRRHRPRRRCCEARRSHPRRS